MNELSVCEPSLESRVGAFLRFSPVIEAVEADRVSSAEAELILFTPLQHGLLAVPDRPGLWPRYVPFPLRGEEAR